VPSGENKSSINKYKEKHKEKKESIGSSKLHKRKDGKKKKKVVYYETYSSSPSSSGAKLSSSKCQEHKK
jgi:hypothetical protein